MIGVWLDEHGVGVRSDLPEPSPRDGEVVVTVTLAGICGTDLGLLADPGHFEGIPGHEFVGLVATGPDEWLGSRVVSEINITCVSGMTPGPECSECAEGRPSHCLSRAALGIFGHDGVFAERVALPIANLHRVPAEVPDSAAVFVEPLAAAFQVLEQVAIGHATRVLVVGPGRLGSLVARAVATTGARPTVAGRSAETLERARHSGLVAISTEHVEDHSYDVAVDCTGHADGFGLARRALRPGGTLVLKSTYPAPVDVDARAIMVDEIHVVGSRCGPFPSAIAALSTGRVEVRDLIDARFPLSEAAKAFGKAAEPGVAKVLLTN